MKPSSTNEIHPGKYFARPPSAGSRVFSGNSLVSSEVASSPEPLLFLGDANTLAALWRVGAGARPQDQVVDLGAPLRLDDTLVSRARELVAPWACHRLVAVGGGTINDLAKLLAFEARRPFTLVASCASMNGWVSPNASIVRGGNKISVPAVAPERVLLDASMLARSPAELTASGVADALAGRFACRDWLVAHHADGSSYDSIVASAVEASIAPLECSLACGPYTDALGPLLTDALVAGGVAMSEAHSSAPASGAEHLVAHAIDLAEIARGARPTLHGHAVGIGSLLVAALWELIAESLAIHDATGDRPCAAATHAAERASAVGTWLPTLAADAFDIVSRKQSQEKTRRPSLAVYAELAALPRLPTVETFRRMLTAAGAPTRAAAVHVDAAFLRSALSYARDMRDRTTVFDLAHGLGVLPARADDVIARSELVDGA